MKTVRLTADQIEQFDEIHFDKQSTDQTLNIAMMRHSNRLVEIMKGENKLWDDIINTNDLDPGIKWTIKSQKGAVYVAEKEEE